MKCQTREYWTISFTTTLQDTYGIFYRTIFSSCVCCPISHHVMFSKELFLYLATNYLFLHVNIIESERYDLL